MKKCRVAAVLGTRPEAIKLALVIDHLRRRCHQFEPVVIATGQHRAMLDQALSLFQITPDVDLDVMRPNQTLESLTIRVLDAVQHALERFTPDILLVQGDTTTALVSALAAYYCKVPVGHVEAGLRSDDLYNPFPEEGNRRLTTVLSAIHFAPTGWARDQLLGEGVPLSKIVVTGNTVVDSLQALVDIPLPWEHAVLQQFPASAGRLVLVTSHRRESWGTDLENICLALKDLAAFFPDIQIVYPVHPNPNVSATANRILQGAERIHLIEPLNHLTFISLLRRCHLVLTDSGGVQEEAPSFGKPVLVLRKVTERPEASQFGISKLVGMSRENIFAEAKRLLSDPEAYWSMSEAVNPYGDGRAAERIVEVLWRWSQGIAPLLEPALEFKVPVRQYPRRRKSDARAEAARQEGDTTGGQIEKAAAGR